MTTPISPTAQQALELADRIALDVLHDIEQKTGTIICNLDLTPVIARHLALPSEPADVRDVFEEWARADNRHIEPQEFEARTPDNNHYYVHGCDNEAYIGWCAALRTLTAPPPPQDGKGRAVMETKLAMVMNDTLVAMVDAGERMVSTIITARVLSRPEFQDVINKAATPPAPVTGPPPEAEIKAALDEWLDEIEHYATRRERMPEDAYPWIVEAARIGAALRPAQQPVEVEREAAVAGLRKRRPSGENGYTDILWQLHDSSINAQERDALREALSVMTRPAQQPVEGEREAVAQVLCEVDGYYDLKQAPDAWMSYLPHASAVLALRTTTPAQQAALSAPQAGQGEAVASRDDLEIKLAMAMNDAICAMSDNGDDLVTTKITAYVLSRPVFQETITRAALGAAPKGEPGAWREAFVGALAALAAAISLLEHTPKSKKAAPSDKMFDQMIVDYKRALETGRAALYAAAQVEETFDLLAYLRRQRAFSEKTFGPGDRAKGVVDHIRKELVEVEEDPKDLKEWIDVVTLALDGAWRAGYSPEQITAQLDATLTRNEKRTWPDWRTMPTDRAIEHDRSKDASPARNAEGGE